MDYSKGDRESGTAEMPDMKFGESSCVRQFSPAPSKKNYLSLLVVGSQMIIAALLPLRGFIQTTFMLFHHNTVQNLSCRCVGALFNFHF